MAWINFTKSWHVIDCDEGLELMNATVTFEGDGSGDSSSKLTIAGKVWGSQATYVGGAGTLTDPEIVTLKRNNGEYIVKRRDKKITCQPSTTGIPFVVVGKLMRPKRRPRFKDLPISGSKRDPIPNETKPIWEAQEGG